SPRLSALRRGLSGGRRRGLRRLELRQRRRRTASFWSCARRKSKPSFDDSFPKLSPYQMEKFLVAAPPPSGDAPAAPVPPRRHRWSRVAAELDGRIDARFRHRESVRLRDSFSEIRTFSHNYYMEGQERCTTYMNRVVNDSVLGFQAVREGISAMEFDKKGIYLASVTASGCLTVHDFETLYCSTYGPSRGLPDESSNYLLHISNSMPLCAVRWNPANQDEIVCVSRQTDMVLLFDIGCVSSTPTEILRKGRSRYPVLSEFRKGLTDVAFSSDDKSWLFASGLDGAVFMWDMRLSKKHCLELIGHPESQFSSVKLNIDNRTVFAATKEGTVHAWDLRGGRASAAFQSHNEVQQLSSVKISTLLGKIPSLKDQTNIVSSEILSIDFNPSCSYQLAFHLDNGWSGALNINTLSVSHLHCPPPDWLEHMNFMWQKLHRKPTWLPTSSIYAVGSASNTVGMHLLDFHPDTSSACHVDYNEEIRGSDEKKPAANKFIPSSQRVVSCAAHPFCHTILAGTQFSSLLVLSQKQESIKNSE
ncbi:Os02g0591600, partial [Oryza sativa Japonica Group]